MDAIVVALIVAVAALSVGRRVWKMVADARRRDDAACGGGCCK